MSHKGWRNAGLIILAGLVILVVSILLYYNGDTSNLLTFTSIMAPVVALLLGVVGLNAFGRESLVKDDRFHALNVWMALGLVVFCLSEIAAVVIHFITNFDEIFFIVGLVQLPALLLWGLGVLGYLRSTNSAMGRSDNDRMWTGSVLFASIAGLILVVFETLYIPGRSLLHTGISVPMIVGLSIILIALGKLLWTLRGGLIMRPLILMFMGVLLFFIRNLFWSFVAYSPGTAFDYVTAIESYVLIGASLIAANRLEEVYDVVDDQEE